MRLSLRAVLVLVATLLVAAPAVSAPSGTVNVPSTLETVPTGVTGDTADDAAIWVNTVDPAASLVTSPADTWPAAVSVTEPGTP